MSCASGTIGILKNQYPFQCCTITTCSVKRDPHFHSHVMLNFPTSLCQRSPGQHSGDEPIILTICLFAVNLSVCLVDWLPSCPGFHSMKRLDPWKSNVFF